MAATSLFLRPDENWVRLVSGVTTHIGATNSAYTDDWIADSIIERPVRATNGTAGWTIAATSGSIDGVAVCNHNIDGGRTITLGGVGLTLAAPAARPNGVPYNAFAYGTVTTSVTSLAVSVASNSAALIVGEVFAGVMRTFPGGGLLANELGGSNLKQVPWSGAQTGRRFDDRQAARSWQSAVLVTRTEQDEMMAWFEAQKNGSLPSLFVPDSSQNDAWVVELQEPTWAYRGSRRHMILNFLEYKRGRW